MRRVETSVVIREGTREVWARLARPECWQGLTEAFSGSRGRYFYSLADPGKPLGVGTDVDVKTRRGKQVMRWRISEWLPLKSLEFTANESARKLTPFHMLMRFQLEELDGETTRVAISLVIVYMNRILEILSLVLPVGFIYARGLNRAASRLRDSA